MDKVTILTKWADIKDILIDNVIANFMPRKNLSFEHIKSREQMALQKIFASVLNLEQLALLIWLQKDPPAAQQLEGHDKS
jgi:hypothetical protein